MKENVVGLSLKGYNNHSTKIKSRKFKGILTNLVYFHKN